MRNKILISMFNILFLQNKKFFFSILLIYNINLYF